MSGFAETTYVLCALTAMACAVLLLRAYIRSRTRLLLWSGICFVALAIENIILFADMIILPASTDLSLVRNIVSLCGVLVLLVGLALDEKSS